MHLPSDEFTQFDGVAYAREQIAQILQACDVRSRVMIYLMASSGMRIGVLRTLRIRDLEQVMENEAPLPFYKIQVYAGTRDKYFTYCSSECYYAIQEYFRYRSGLKENLTSSAPLIREQFNVDNPITINVPRFLSEPTINYIIYDVVKRSRIFDSNSKNKKNVQTSHGLRKFFMTTCEHSGMKSINVKLLMGHNIGVSGHYYSPSESDIFEDYRTHAADALTINSEPRLQNKLQRLETEQSNELRAMKFELESMKGELKRLSEDWILFSKPDWDILRTRRPDIMKLLNDPTSYNSEMP